MSAPSPTTPKPRDPRTPLERAQAQLAAIHDELRGPSLSRSRRRQLADRIHELNDEISSLSS
ncbi:hypothetical protein [Streptomyces malaysiensis]|uniref:Uncharacterized protein n=1 Tax=Streptomyces malaysiensis subsp. samsunensis TaxID=459658 RepID=A0A9X2M1S1_STRMQ|nr:hypothetical protein [Streptomyces samsunensis]MCQ8833747.1 hypothetical protein [Streptomyces samsunensis]